MRKFRGGFARSLVNDIVSNIVTAKKRLITLTSDGTDDYRIWDFTKQQFIDVLDDCALVMSVGFREIDEEKECNRLRKLSDEELICEGQAACFWCAPNQNFRKPL
jgi:hypothetical protein